MNSDHRAATPAELQRDLDRVRRAREAMENHKRPARTHGAKLRDAIAYTHIKKPDTAGGEYRVSEICRADDTENNTPS